jgi:hypothetical protein
VISPPALDAATTDDGIISKRVVTTFVELKKLTAV